MKPPKPGAKPKKRFDDAKAHKPFKTSRTRTYHRAEEQGPTEGFDRQKPPPGERPAKPGSGFVRKGVGAPARKPGRKFERKAGPTFARPASERPGRDSRPPHRVSGDSAAAPAATGGPAARGPSEGVELTLTVPFALKQRLDAHAAELGVDVLSLVRVWLADKLRA